MAWGLEKRSSDGVAMSAETEKPRIQKSHKNGKLDTVTFTLIGQKRQTLKSQANQNYTGRF